MEVNPGYKQTEIGVIPEEWEVKPLKRISPRESVGLVINPSTYFDKAGTVPLLVGSNVAENAIDSTSANRITKASNELLPASRLVAGDLVTVRVGEPGVTAVVPPELDGCNCASMMIVRQHQSFDSHWLCWMMNSQHGRRQVEHVQYGTAQKQFNISHAVDFLYPVPSLREQRAMATALSDVDGLLGGLDRLIAKKRDLKQAAMQQLLTGQTRLPGFHGEWEVKRLGEVTDTDPENLGSDTRPDFAFNYISLEDVDQGTLRGHSEQVFCNAPSRARRKLRDNDVLVSTVRPNLKSHLLFRHNGQPWVCSTGFCVVRCREKVTHPSYVFFHMFGHPVARQIEALLTGSNYPAINSGDVRALEIPFPDFAEQTAIAEVLTDMDAELAALEQRREKTRALKQAMMQELLTGRTRLP
jgi:type I restriction enzyme S subunit